MDYLRRWELYNAKQHTFWKFPNLSLTQIPKPIHFIYDRLIGSCSYGVIQGLILVIFYSPIQQYVEIYPVFSLEPIKGPFSA